MGLSDKLTGRLFKKAAELMPEPAVTGFRAPVRLPEDFDAGVADLKFQVPYRKDLASIIEADETLAGGPKGND